MTKLGDALRRKFKSPEAAIKALGLDASVLKTVMVGDKALANDAKFKIGDTVYHKSDRDRQDPGKVQSIDDDGQNVEVKTKSGRYITDRHSNYVAKDKSITGDSTRKERPMSAKAVTLTRKAAMVMGGLVGFLKPKLAKDAKLDWGKIVGPITVKNFASKKGAIVAGVKEQTKGKLAKDASIDGLVELLDGFEKVEGEDDLESNSGLPIMGGKHTDLEDESMDDADPHEGLKSYLAGKGMSEDDISGAIDALGPDAETPGERNPPGKLGSTGAAEEGEDEKDDDDKAEDDVDDADAGKFAKAKDKSAKDEPPPFKGKPEVGGGMSKDAVNKAIRTATDTAIKQAKEEAKATRDAERFVRPWVGDLAMAHDSAEAVYKTALGALGIDTKGVHPSAYKVILERIPQPGKKQAQDSADTDMAQDGASVSEYNKRFPMAARIGRA